MHTQRACASCPLCPSTELSGSLLPWHSLGEGLDGLRWTTGFLLPSVKFIIKVGSAEIPQGYLVHDQQGQGV